MQPALRIGAVEIRTATDADRPRITDMAVRFIQTTRYGAFLTPARPALDALTLTVLAHGVIYVAEASRLPIECAYFAPGVVDRCRNCGEARELHGPYVIAMLALVAQIDTVSGDLFAEEQAWWVEPEYRASRIAWRLQKYGIEWAIDRGCAFLKMSAPVDAPEVGAFYERRGFIPVETAFIKLLPRKAA